MVCLNIRGAGTYIAGDISASLTFRIAEQYMMYHKAILFNDQKIADRIILESDPRKQ